MRVEEWIDSCKNKNQRGKKFTVNVGGKDISIEFDGDHTITANGRSADVNKGNQIDGLYNHLGIYWNTSGRVSS